MTKLFRAVFMAQIFVAYGRYCERELVTEYQWKYIDYNWTSPEQKEEAIRSGRYDFRKSVPTDTQYLPDGRVLIVTPNDPVSPACLSTVSPKSRMNNPLLQPYPSWDWHSGSCSGITSTTKVILDKCRRLWFVDNGKIGKKHVCPASIKAFQTSDDTLIESFEIPAHLARDKPGSDVGRLEIQAVETYGIECGITWVYISDVESNSLLIWNGRHIWRLREKFFGSDESRANFTTAGESVHLPLGISVTGIIPSGYLDQKYLLVKPLASRITYAASLRELHNSISGAKVNYFRQKLEQPSQGLAVDISKNTGVMLGSFAEEPSIYCWNLQNPLTTSTIDVVAQNASTLQFVTSVKIVETPYRESEKVVFLSTKFQKHILGTLNFNVFNFRILTAGVTCLIRGTVCEPKRATIEDRSFIPSPTC